jgi:hypothetical protein
MEYFDSENENENENENEFQHTKQIVDDLFENYNMNIIQSQTQIKECIYPGLQLLNDDLTNIIQDMNTSGTVHICAYQINNTGLSPFLQFILQKFSKTHETSPDNLSFPSFQYTKTMDILLVCDLILQVIFTSYKFLDNYYKYKGFINIENDLYLFYDCSTYAINNHILYRQNDLWLVLIDEIINHSKVCNFPIDNHVHDFFINNKEFIYLKDEYNNRYETPTVAYNGTSKRKLELISVFGVPKTINYNLKDPYFFFTNYSNAIKMDEYTTIYGINRFALFLGHTNINASEIKIGGLNSIYIGNNELSPLWALPTYEQQLPLTSHYIDKTLLVDIWDKNTDYFIL